MIGRAVPRTGRPKARGALAAAAGLALAGPAEADLVERRGAEPSVAGEVAIVDDAGVTVRSDSGAEHFVPWDRVRRVEMDRPEPGLEDRLRVATDLWRARSRVQRGDHALAEPLLERLFETYRGRTHGIARLAAEGLLRCRLARGANELAVIPALEVARLVRAGAETESFAGLRPVVDETTALCPELAPTWTSPALLRKVERDLGDFDAGGDPVVAALRDLYRTAVRRELGTLADDETPAPDLARSEHPGVALLARVVACEADDPERRRAAREALAADLGEAVRWTEAWSRFAIGASLLRETGVGRRQRGMVQMLHVPARHRSRLPYLAGVALARVAEASRRAGDDDAATALEEELRRSLPGHPLLARPPTARGPLPDAQHKDRA